MCQQRFLLILRHENILAKRTLNISGVEVLGISWTSNYMGITYKVDAGDF